MTGLLGANGAGKTTLLGLMLGLHRPDSGSLTVFGRDPWLAGAEVRMRLGYAPEHDALPPDVAAHDVVRHLAELHGLPRREATSRASDALWEVGLGEERFRPVGTMSTGQRQRVKLAQAIAHDPELALARRAHQWPGSVATRRHAGTDRTRRGGPRHARGRLLPPPRRGRAGQRFGDHPGGRAGGCERRASSNSARPLRSWSSNWTPPDEPNPAPRLVATLEGAGLVGRAGGADKGRCRTRRHGRLRHRAGRSGRRGLFAAEARTAHGQPRRDLSGPC